MKICTLMIMVASWSGSVFGQQNMYCQLSLQHDLCVNQGIGPDCGQMEYRGVSDSDAALIVSLHNQFRSQVARGLEGRGSPGPQPQASNMMVLEWDYELANVAQSQADQCIFEHECADCRRVSRFGVGQNLFLTMQGQDNNQIQWERAIRVWYDEVSTFDSRSIVPFRFSTPAGHYTMMMWWNSQKIGCGFTMSRNGFLRKKLYTCDYGPGGNIMSSAMYIPGPPCSACPDGTTCSQQYPGLCGDVRAFDASIGLHPLPGLPFDSAVHIDATYGVSHIPLQPVFQYSSVSDERYIYTMPPEYESIVALREYFYNNRRGIKVVQLMDVLLCIFKRRQRCSVTPTINRSPTENNFTNTTSLSLIDAPSSVISVTTQLPLEISAQDSSTLIVSSSASSVAITPSSVVVTSDDITTSVSTSETTTTTDTTAIFDIAASSVTSVLTSTLPPSEVSTLPIVTIEGTVTTVPYHYNLTTKVSTLPVSNQEQDEVLELQEPQKVELEIEEPQKAELKLQEPQRDGLELQEPVKVELELQDPQGVVLEHLASGEMHQEQQFKSLHRDQLQDSDLMPFLQRAGVNKDVIRVDSISTVQAIISFLPHGVKPIVLYRTAPGKVTELDPGTLLPVSKYGRSTASIVDSPVELLACDLDVSPCDMTPVGSSWKISSSPMEGRYLEASLGENEVAQIAYHKLIGVPATNGICVAVSHRRTLADGVPSSATLPELKVVIMPLDGDFKIVSLGGNPGQWEMSRVSISNIKAPFVVALSIVSSRSSATIDIDALRITDGLCCVSGLC